MGSSRRIEKCSQSGWGCMGGGATDQCLEGNHYPVQLYEHTVHFVTPQVRPGPPYNAPTADLRRTQDIAFRW